MEHSQALLNYAKQFATEGVRFYSLLNYCHDQFNMIITLDVINLLDVLDYCSCTRNISNLMLLPLDAKKFKINCEGTDTLKHRLANLLRSRLTHTETDL